MKTISVNISEAVYDDFVEHARRTDRTAAELAMLASTMQSSGVTSILTLDPNDFPTFSGFTFPK